MSRIAKTCVSYSQNGLWHSTKQETLKKGHKFILLIKILKCLAKVNNKMKLKNLKVESKKGKWVCIFFTFRGRTQSNAYIICQEEMSFQDETKWKWSILHYTAIYHRKSVLKSFFMALFLNGQKKISGYRIMYIFQNKIYHNFQENL